MNSGYWRFHSAAQTSGYFQVGIQPTILDIFTQLHSSSLLALTRSATPLSSALVVDEVEAPAVEPREEEA